jgi:hypothetical protein
MREHHLSRRHFLRTMAVAGPAAGTLFMVNPALGQDLPRLSMDDPLAKGLMYVEVASESDAPNYKPGQNCENCLHIQGNEGDAWRPCAIIPGKSVAADGWCSAWVAKS